MKNLSIKRIVSASCAFVMALSMVACGAQTPAEPAEEVTEAPAPEVEATIETTEDTEAVADGAVLELDGTRSLLTGETLDSSLVSQRVLAVMVENTKACLPHYNLDQAGIVMEAPAEGQITRYMAIFDDWADLTKIGNIRSCRTYYAQVAEEYDAIYVHWGQSPFAEPYLLENYVDDLNALSIAARSGYSARAAASCFFRDPPGGNEHSGYTSGEKVTKAIADKGYRTTYKDGFEPHWSFAADGSKVTLDEGEDCVVFAPYYQNNKPYFIYNSEDGLYYRYEFGSAEKDGASGNQYAVTNIVCEIAPDDYYQENGKNNPRGYLQFYLEGTGKGYYMTNGKKVDITWSKDNYTGRTKYFMADGTELVLNQGKTWFCLMEPQYDDENGFYATEADFH